MSLVYLAPFTGPEAESPWWLPTWYVAVRGQSGVVVYGEMSAISLRVEYGDCFVSAGDVLGEVTRVLTRAKDKPTCMLHIELYESATFREPMWWREGGRPAGLLDPTPHLKAAPALAV